MIDINPIIQFVLDRIVERDKESIRLEGRGNLLVDHFDQLVHIERLVDRARDVVDDGEPVGVPARFAEQTRVLQRNGRLISQQFEDPQFIVVKLMRLAEGNVHHAAHLVTRLQGQGQDRARFPGLISVKGIATGVRHHQANTGPGDPVRNPILARLGERLTLHDIGPNRRAEGQSRTVVEKNVSIASRDQLERLGNDLLQHLREIKRGGYAQAGFAESFQFRIALALYLEQVRVFHCRGNLVREQDEQPLILRAKRVRSNAQHAENAAEFILMLNRHPHARPNGRIDGDPARIRLNVSQVERHPLLGRPNRPARGHLRSKKRAGIPPRARLWSG